METQQVSSWTVYRSLPLPLTNVLLLFHLLLSNLVLLVLMVVLLPPRSSKAKHS